jgi:hypothetical protein
MIFRIVFKGGILHYEITLYKQGWISTSENKCEKNKTGKDVLIK